MRQPRRGPDERVIGRIAPWGVAAALLLPVVGGSCGGDSGPGLPPPLTCPSAQVPLCTNTTGAAMARDGTSDAVSRSTPALENAAARTALAASLGQLDGALAAGNVTDARAALTRAREAIAAARGQLTAFPGDAADLAAIELSLDHVAPLLGAS